MKIVFFGTSNVALPILEALSKKHEVLAVVTSPDARFGRKQEIKESPVSVLANEMKLKVLKPLSVKDNSDFLNELQSLNAEIFVVVSYGKILPLSVINLPKYKTLNVHFSVLPKYRGSSPIQYALLNGDKYTGTSVFILDEKVDHGALLGSEIVEIGQDDNFLTLSQKLAYKSAAIINELIADYVSGKITPQIQDEQAATFTKIITREQGKINWQNTSTTIYNQFRAFYPWPGVWTTWNGRIIKLIDIEISLLHPPAIPTLKRWQAGKTTEALSPGLVLQDGMVMCGESSYIKIKILQMEGKKEMPFIDFINGFKDFLGSVLN